MPNIFQCRLINGRKNEEIKNKIHLLHIINVQIVLIINGMKKQSERLVSLYTWTPSPRYWLCTQVAPPFRADGPNSDLPRGWSCLAWTHSRSLTSIFSVFLPRDGAVMNVWTFMGLDNNESQLKKKKKNLKHQTNFTSYSRYDHESSIKIRTQFFKSSTIWSPVMNHESFQSGHFF
jgi:hypothetical protein